MTKRTRVTLFAVITLVVAITLGRHSSTIGVMIAFLLGVNWELIEALMTEDEEL